MSYADNPKELCKLLDKIGYVICVTDGAFNILYSNQTFTNNFKKTKKLRDLFDKVEFKKITQSAAKLARNQSSAKIDVFLKPYKKWYLFKVDKLEKEKFLFYGHDVTENVLAQNSMIEQTQEMEKIKNAVLNLLEDMTETQENLRQANKDLRQLDKLKNEFISIASHELRTPMTSIKGFLSMILEGDAGKVPMTINEFILEAYNSNEHLISLVNDMLDVSRIEQGRVILDIGKHKALPLIKETIDSMSMIAKEGHNKIILKSDVNENVKVFVDPKRFQQVLINLLSNAIKFSEKGDIVVHAKKRGRFLSLSVTDKGIGMSKEEMKKLFEKFYQVRSGLARPTGGSGLGLYITKNLIEQMGGSISVISKKGKGSTFTFSVPISRRKRSRRTS